MKNVWQKGETGNRRGRPKIPADVKEAARAHTVDAIKTLAACVRTSKAPWQARVMAAEKLLDRGWGKADSNVNVTGTVTLASLLASLPASDAEHDEAPALN